MTTIVWCPKSRSMAADRRTSRGSKEACGDASKITHFANGTGPWYGGKRIRLIGGAGRVSMIEMILEHFMFFEENTHTDAVNAAQEFFKTPAGEIYLKMVGRTISDQTASFLLVAEDDTAAVVSASDILAVTAAGRLLVKEAVVTFSEKATAIGSGARHAKSAMHFLKTDAAMAVLYAATQDPSTGTELQIYTLKDETGLQWTSTPRVSMTALRDSFKAAISFDPRVVANTYADQANLPGTQAGEMYAEMQRARATCKKAVKKTVVKKAVKKAKEK